MSDVSSKPCPGWPAQTQTVSVPEKFTALWLSLPFNHRVYGPLGYLNFVHLLGLRKFMEVLKAKIVLRVWSPGFWDERLSVLVLACVVFPHHYLGWPIFSQPCLPIINQSSLT